VLQVAAGIVIAVAVLWVIAFLVNFIWIH